jgi:hypothetical protein
MTTTDTPRLTLALLLVLPLLAIACASEPPAEEAPEPIRVENPAMGLAFSQLPEDFVVEANDPEQIVVVSDDPERAGTMTVEVGEPSDFGIELDQKVWEDRERVEARSDGEYLGGNKLMSQLGEAFYSRSRIEEEGAVIETVRVFALHPTENRLVTLSYRYPAADDSSERLPEVLQLLGAIEIPDAAPE